MNVLIYLVPMALALGLTGLAAFLWSLRTGQYEDMDGAALRVLSDDDLRSTQPFLDEGRTLRVDLPQRSRPGSMVSCRRAAISVPAENGDPTL